MSLIARSLWTPIRRIKDVLKIFWPPLLLLCAYYGALGFNLVSALNAGTLKIPSAVMDVITSPVTVWIFLIYIFLVFFSGIVNWHRKIVLGEKATRARFLPFGRDFSYAGHILWMTIVAFFYQKLIVTILRPKSMGVSPDAAELISYILTPFLFAFFFKKLLLVLPSLSVENKDFHLNYGLLAKATKGLAWPLSVGALIVATEWIAEIPGVIYLLTQATGSLYQSLNQYLIIIALLPLMKVLLLSYGAIVFATILSYFYRDRVRDDLLAYNQNLKDEQQPALAQ